MRQAFILLLYTFFLYSCKSPGKKDNPVELTEMPIVKKKKNLVVTATGDNRIFIDEKDISDSNIDSVLKVKTDALKEHFQDTVTIVINADTATSYGVVFLIVKSAKKIGAKVVANVH